MSRKNRHMPPVHPGEILREDLMKPLGLSVNGLARELKVRLPGSVKSSTAGAASMQTRHSHFQEYAMLPFDFAIVFRSLAF